jgi:hypothetical protein
MTNASTPCSLIAASVCLAHLALNCAWAQKTSSPAPVMASIPKSVFVHEVSGGKDPFFPESRRRIPSSNPGTGANPSVAWDVGSQLLLKGIAISKERRLALINNVTLAPGEKAAIKAGAYVATVHCLEIRARSVLVSIDGSRNFTELRLRE